MMRWCFNILAAFSLLLLVATVGLWVRSYWVSDRLLWRAGGWASLSVYPNRGSIAIMRAENTPDHFEFIQEPAAEGRFPRCAARIDLKWTMLGIAYYADPDIHHGWILSEGQRPLPAVEVVMPIWPLVLLLAIFPSLRCYLWFKRRRPAPGHCLKCGYDLRASTERCPECGTPIPAGLVKEPIR